jgi:hypothetical protein
MWQMVNGIRGSVNVIAKGRESAARRCALQKEGLGAQKNENYRCNRDRTTANLVPIKPSKSRNAFNIQLLTHTDVEVKGMSCGVEPLIRVQAQALLQWMDSFIS